MNADVRIEEAPGSGGGVIPAAVPAEAAEEAEAPGSNPPAELGGSDTPEGQPAAPAAVPPTVPAAVAKAGGRASGGGRVTKAQPAQPAKLAQPRVTNVSYSSSGTDLDTDRAPAVARRGGRNNPNLPAAQAAAGGGGAVNAAAGAVADANRVGRNDPCPCGSGRKYKSCWGTPNCKQSGNTPTAAS
ncbi:MAG: SEC-C metal-binding domain-containing protein [Acidimicrobiales bacterium]